VVPEIEHPPTEHPFVRAPHRTLLALSLPVLLSLIAEPLTGLVDTAFVARLGAAPLAALGVGTVALSGIFWIFSFLMIGTQTEVAQALGRGAPDRARQMTSLALMLCGLIGSLLIVLFWPAADLVARALGATDAIRIDAVRYMQIRLLGAPAVLAVMTALGALRGLQAMRTALWIAVGINLLNIVLDPLLIHGWGGLPALGVGGAALASVISQWLGALAAVAVIARRLGFSTDVRLRDLHNLLSVGRDLFIRTGVLLLFLMFATREATRLGAESGAAHQAIRQIYVFTALFLEAFATTAQSLVGYFWGSGIGHVGCTGLGSRAAGAARGLPALRGGLAGLRAGATGQRAGLHQRRRALGRGRLRVHAQRHDRGQPGGRRSPLAGGRHPGGPGRAQWADLDLVGHRALDRGACALRHGAHLARFGDESVCVRGARGCPGAVSALKFSHQSVRGWRPT
jgi:MATE family multidrug resistance protein